MAYIAGYTEAQNLADLNCFACRLASLKLVCGITRDPLVFKMNPANWNDLFNGFLNDAIVAVTSQMNGNPQLGKSFPGVIHSAGLRALSFDGSSELDSGPISSEIIDLLNEPKTGNDYEQ